MKTTFALLSLLIIPACGAPRGRVAKDSDPAISTDRERYVLRAGEFGPEVAIVARFRAPEDRAVYVMNCNGAISSRLQRQVGDGWVDAWAATVNGCLSEPIAIAAGGNHTATVLVRPRSGAVLYPGGKQDGMIEEGTYRLVWDRVLTSFNRQARPVGPELPLTQRISNSFQVAVPLKHVP